MAIKGLVRDAIELMNENYSSHLNNIPEDITSD
jgi:hypothetical protein